MLSRVKTRNLSSPVVHKALGLMEIGPPWGHTRWVTRWVTCTCSTLHNPVTLTFDLLTLGLVHAEVICHRVYVYQIWRCLLKSFFFYCADTHTHTHTHTLSHRFHWSPYPRISVGNYMERQGKPHRPTSKLGSENSERLKLYLLVL